MSLLTICIDFLTILGNFLQNKDSVESLLFTFVAGTPACYGQISVRYTSCNSLAEYALIPSFNSAPFSSLTIPTASRWTTSLPNVTDSLQSLIAKQTPSDSHTFRCYFVDIISISVDKVKTLINPISVMAYWQIVNLEGCFIITIAIKK